MSHSSSAPHPDQKTAILAEDDEMIRELVALYLEKLGYETVAVENGKLALAEFEQRPNGSVELLVSDLMMPEIGGVELVTEAMENGYCSKILLISGYSSEAAFLEKAIAKGCQFLKKPFTLKEFEDRVKSLVEIQTS